MIDFGVGDPREPTPGVHPRGAGRGRSPRCRPTRARSGCRRTARRSPAWIGRAIRRRGRSGDRDRADARVEGGDLLVRAGGARPSGAASRSRASPTRCTSAARSSPAPTCVDGAAARGARLAAGSRRVRPLGRDRRCSGRATRTTRPAPPPRSRSTRSSPAGRASTASCSARTRPTPSSGSATSPSRRSRSPTARTSSSSTRSRSARR